MNPGKPKLANDPGSRQRSSDNRLEYLDTNANNTMIFTIAVHGAPYASQSNQHALKFSEAAIAAGHQISRIFFYHEGVYAALNSRVPPQDEGDVTAEWQAFAQQNDVELAVCIANGLKRGILSEGERARYEKSSATLADGFELVGLGQLIDAIATSDRYIEFPA